ncbi:acyltransferase family protein [Hanstruepera ponticola]|uniref:acyltransferase family protein n=1 Tax=Hanstruepera ponticola TaxID=2042995 RepID=UPI001785760D|nr:acyltransferase [Hanstruepera ponticola]
MFGTLRTLLAINVILLHIFNIPTLGNYSVSFFFILSGFLMTYIMHNTYGYKVSGFKVFWLNRALRLYPVYIVIMIFTMITLYFFNDIIRHKAIFYPNNLLEWVYNITMYYPKIIPHQVEPRLVPPSWALTNELTFYLLISIGISKSKKRTLIWLFLSVLYFVATYLFYDIPTYRYSAIPASSLPFALGASLYWYKDRLKFKAYIYYPIILYLIFILNGLYSNELNLIVNDISIYLNMFLSLLIIYLLFNLKPKNKKKFNYDSYLGQYSYPLYLSHFFVAILYSGIIGIGVFDNSFKINFIGLPLYFILLFVFNFIIVHLVDSRVNKIKEKIKKTLT